MHGTDEDDVHARARVAEAKGLAVFHHIPEGRRRVVGTDRGGGMPATARRAEGRAAPNGRRSRDARGPSDARSVVDITSEARGAVCDG